MRTSVLGPLLLLGCAATQPVPPSFVDDRGNISIPAGFDYHHAWRVIGPGDDPAQRVYVAPETAAAWKHAQDFPDGAVLLKESGDPQALRGWFVMIRDQKGRFRGNPHWAQGWGWAWIDARRPDVMTGETFGNSCQGCHRAVEATRWVHVGEYDWR